MANSDKNILITPSVGLSTNPTIKFTGANNTPTTLRVLDDGTVSFEATAGQLFSISDGLTGSIFSVNDISGIPSIEVLDTGLVKVNQYGGSTVFGTSAAIQNSSSVNAKVSVSTASAATPGLIIKGVSSQSANLQEWQNSSGTVLSYINSLGFTAIYAGLYVSGGGGQSTALLSVAGAPSVSSIIARGQTSQTADLQQWQNSAGTVLANIESGGALSISPNSASNGYSIYIAGAGSGGVLTMRSTATSAHFVQLQNSSNTPVFKIDNEGRVVPTATTSAGLIIRGLASQAANLQEWQNSSGTVLAKVDANGVITSNLGIYAGSASFSGVSWNGISNPTGITSLPTLVIKGVASQTANLQEWQNSAGSMVANVNFNGDILATGSYYTNNAYFGGSAPYMNATVNIRSQQDSYVGVAIRARSSQTGNLQEWQNSSGTVLAKVDANGYIYSSKLSLLETNPSIDDNSGAAPYIVFRSVGIEVNTRAATKIGLIVKGAASQTANLQEWQNSSGTVLAKVDSSGIGTFAQGSFAGGAATIDGGGGAALGAIYTGSLKNSPTSYNFFSNVTGSTYATVVIKQLSGQTTNLQEWQNSSGAAMGRFDPYGYFNAYGYTLPNNGSFESAYGGAFMGMKKTTSTVANPGADIARIYLVAGTNAGTLKLVVKAGASGAETTILDNIPQS